MRARLTYLTLSPRTPQRVAAGAVQLLALLAAIAGMIAVMTGAASHVLFSGIVLAGTVLGVAA
jgi:hypothetical protein